MDIKLQFFLICYGEIVLLIAFMEYLLLKMVLEDRRVLDEWHKQNLQYLKNQVDGT